VEPGPPECYLKYFLDKTPPQELLVPETRRFICQTVPDIDPQVDFFATLFDDGAGIAIFSAYVVTYEQAHKIDSNKRPKDGWRTNPGEKNTGFAGSSMHFVPLITPIYTKRQF